jgi:hypothetical protein
MMLRRRPKDSNFYIILTDISFSILITFIFLLVVILITSRTQQTVEYPRIKKENAAMKQQLEELEQDNQRLYSELGDVGDGGSEAQLEEVLQAVGLNNAKGRKDFDLFVKGLNAIPGQDIHLVIDATGSMHGVSGFLVPLLRVIVARSHKEVSAITWFSDNKADTYQGTMGEMLDSFMKGAPFVGGNETIGDAFFRAEESAPAPGAYVLLGDEPSDDRIYYLDIPAPVFTIPIGRADPNTWHEYNALAEKTHGKLLQLTFQ